MLLCLHVVIVAFLMVEINTIKKIMSKTKSNRESMCLDEGSPDCYVPLAVYNKAQSALAYGASKRQVENIVNDWLRENNRPANFSLTQNKEK